MQNGNMLRVRAGVRVRVVTRASVGVMVRFYFAVVLFNFCHNFTHSALQRCRMGIALGLGFGSGVRIKVRLALGSGLYFFIL